MEHRNIVWSFIWFLFNILNSYHFSSIYVLYTGQKLQYIMYTSFYSNSLVSNKVVFFSLQNRLLHRILNLNFQQKLFAEFYILCMLEDETSLFLSPSRASHVLWHFNLWNFIIESSHFFWHNNFIFVFNARTDTHSFVHI